MAHVGLVVNPAANGNRGAAAGAAIAESLSRSGHLVTDLSAATAEQALNGARAATHAGAGRIDALVVAGGDGMVHLGINAVAGTSVPLGLIALGSGNDFARTVGLPAQDGRNALAIIDEALRAGQVRTIDLLRAQDADGNVSRTVCVISAGLDAAVNARANGYTFPPGGGKYLRAAMVELRRFRPYGYAITLDGHRREVDCTLVAIANGCYYGGGMRIAPNAVVNDGLADVLIARGMSAWQAARLLPRLYDGSHLRDPAVELVQARHIELHALPDHPHPPAGYGDGELIGALPLRIDVEPGALRLLAPAVV